MPIEMKIFATIALVSFALSLPCTLFQTKKDDHYWEILMTIFGMSFIAILIDTLWRLM